MDESFVLRDRVYGLEDLSQHADREGRLDLSYAYVFHTMPTLKRRLVQGGVRLAGVLNALFDENPQGTACDLPFIKDTVRLRGSRKAVFGARFLCTKIGILMELTMRET